jgi:hypothetical protein
MSKYRLLDLLPWCEFEVERLLRNLPGMEAPPDKPGKLRLPNIVYRNK